MALKTALLPLLVVVAVWMATLPLAIAPLGTICGRLGLAPSHRYWLLLPLVGPVVLSLVVLFRTR